MPLTPEERQRIYEEEKVRLEIRQHLEARSPGRHGGPSNGVAAVLSLVIPGAGQIYKGHTAQGFAWLIGTILGYVALVVPGIIIHFTCVYHAATQIPADLVLPSTPTPQSPPAAARPTDPSPPMDGEQRKSTRSLLAPILITVAVVVFLLGSQVWRQYPDDSSVSNATPSLHSPTHRVAVGDAICAHSAGIAERLYPKPSRAGAPISGVAGRDDVTYELRRDIPVYVEWVSGGVARIQITSGPHARAYCWLPESLLRKR